MSETLLCHKCAAELTPGEGNFYVVRIEALLDPTPPAIAAEDLRRDLDAEFRRLLAEMRDMSEQELRDQVYRSLTLHLCGRCYRRWIEDPTG